MSLIYDWNPRFEAGRPPRLVDHTLSCARLTPGLHLNETVQVEVIEALEGLGLEDLCVGSWADPEVAKLSSKSACLWAEAAPGMIPPPPFSIYLSHRHKNWRQVALKSDGRAVVLVIQDATRFGPKEMIDLLKQVPGSGVTSICLSDDGGRAVPSGATQLVAFVQQCLQRLGLELSLEWSGRNDRGLALANCLAAWQAGAQALHGSFFSLGEGAGLVAMEQLLVNLQLSGHFEQDLTGLGCTSHRLAELLGQELYPNLPIVGADAFRTGTGVHAAAILKARKKGDEELADLIYSGVPAQRFGFGQIIEVGPMAGASNVQYWLESQGLPTDKELVSAILVEAKGSQKVLSDEEMLNIVRLTQAGGVR
jgi:isopropylmalate/homocitrate/citramalate synthase